MSHSPATRVRGSELALALAGAVYHPAKDIRTHLRRALERRVRKWGSAHAESDIERVLLSQPGTALEPFELTPEDLWLAVTAGRIAFSKRHQKTRLRVVSRDTIGNQGGAILTNNLGHYYVERYAYGYRRRAPKTAWFIAPGVIAESLRDIDEFPAAGLTAKTSVEQAGIRIEIEGACWEACLGENDTTCAGRIQSASTIDGQSLSPLGLRIAVNGDRILIETGSPESVLRLTALAERSALLMLDTGLAEAYVGRVVVRLAPGGKRTKTLPVIATCRNVGSLGWTDIIPATSLGIDRDTRLALGRWLLPPDSWVDEEYLRAVL